MKPPGAARRHLEREHKELAVSLRQDLTALRDRVAGALDALNGDGRLDPHLIANSVMLTADIARWNLVRDLALMVTEET